MIYVSAYVFRNISVTRLSLPAQHGLWLGAGLVFGFLMPFVFADMVELQRDVFYGLYAGSVVAFVTLWARTTGQSIGDGLRRRWALALGLGLLFAAVMTFIVVRSEDATARPDGLELIAAVLWRGVVYGMTDGLLLSVFPILVVFAAFANTTIRDRRPGTVAIGGVALAASLAMTATYHLGYSDFRSEKVGRAVGGDVIWSVPTLLTLNPVGAPIAHAGLHVSAVLHSYETDLFLPPHDSRD